MRRRSRVLREMIKRQEQHKPSDTFLAIRQSDHLRPDDCTGEDGPRDEKLVPCPKLSRRSQSSAICTVLRA